TVQGTVLVSFGVYFAGETGDVYGLLFFWVVIYASYFFPWRAVCVHVLAVGVAYAVVLHAQGRPSLPSVAWVITVGTLSVAGALVVILTGRLARALAELTASESESRERGTRLEAVIQSAPIAIVET